MEEFINSLLFTITVLTSSIFGLWIAHHLLTINSRLYAKGTYKDLLEEWNNISYDDEKFNDYVIIRFTIDGNRTFMLLNLFNYAKYFFFRLFKVTKIFSKKQIPMWNDIKREKANG